MMKNKLISKRYAEAYIAFAEPKTGMLRCIEDMKDVRTVLRQNPDFLHFLQAPEIPKKDKAGMLDRVLGEVLTDETRTFIKYLIDKSRITLLSSIAEYIRIVYSHGEVVDVVLRTTFPMELDIIGRIKAKVEVFAHKKVNFYLELDPDLLGGAQLLIGNTIIDGSVRNRLMQLKKQMLSAKVAA
jgi:F-type H+-transporting ATPase subunit delta